MRTPEEALVRSRIRMCRRKLAAGPLTAEDHEYWTKLEYFWLGWLDCMTGERP